MSATSIAMLLLAAITSLSMPQAMAARADLPTANEVKPSRKMKLDGEYRISTLNKRVLIDRGRSIVKDGWKHMFLWDVEPGMVVVRDIRYAGNGVFKGRDLALKGEWRGTYNERTGYVNVVVDGSMGPVKFDLIPVVGGAQDDPYEDAEPVESLVAAIRMGNAKLPKVSACPGKRSYLSGGACWLCPNGYRRARLTREMDHPKACEKGAFTNKTYKPARRQGNTHARCPSGQFHVAEQGINGCYKCPPGSQRDNNTRNSTMCISRR